MRDVLGSLRGWYDEGGPVAVATVVGTSAIAHLALYIGTAHLDLRSWIASGLLDVGKRRGAE